MSHHRFQEVQTRPVRNAFGSVVAEESVEVTGYVNPWGRRVEVSARPYDEPREMRAREALAADYQRRRQPGNPHVYVEATVKALREQAIEAGGGHPEYVELLEARLAHSQTQPVRKEGWLPAGGASPLTEQSKQATSSLVVLRETTRVPFTRPTKES